MLQALKHFCLTLRVIGIFLFLDWGFSFLGFERTRDALLRRARKSPTHSPIESDKTALHEIVVAVDAANRYYYRKRLDCLPRALATYYLARQRSVLVEFCLGVKKFPFAGHTWVEYQGEVIGDHLHRVRAYTILVRE